MQQERSYTEYLKLVSNEPDIMLYENGDEIIDRFRDRHFKASRYAPVVYLVDYTRRKYIYVSEACYDMYGYSAKLFMEEGLDAYINKWHPADLTVMNNHIFPQNLKFLQSIAPENYNNLIFSFNYRTLNIKGDYITILQRSSYIPGNIPGKPLGSIGVAFDITHFKTDLNIVHTIEEVEEYNGSLINRLLYKKTYPVQENKGPISDREAQILQLLAKGHSSKQIAGILNISTHTVNNHRKNMLFKTDSKNTAGLLNYAAQWGYL